MNRFFRTTLAVTALLTSVFSGEASARSPVRFQTGGQGVFSPANLGVGIPGTQPTIVGYGSGLSAYNGTPVGYEFRLDGQLVGDGWDRHYGAAQTFTPGILAGPEDAPASIIIYPYVTANNPIRPGRKIHLMETRQGQVWFEYDGYFTLDTTEGLALGTLVSRSVFRIVGGTRKFAAATGSVNVITRTNLSEITANGAPFRYDFDGFIHLRH